MPIRVLELRSVWGTGGGPDKTILLGAARADPARVQVTVCYLRADRDPAFTLDRQARALGIDYVEVRERWSWDPRIWTALRGLVRHGGYDIVHAHEYKTDVLALLLARAEGVMPLATAHYWSGTSVRERWLYFPVDRWLLARYPLVVAVSAEVRAELLASGAHPDRIVVVPNGIDAEAFRRVGDRCQPARAALGLAPDAPVVLSVCRLEPIKRLDLLIDAVARVRHTHPTVCLVLAGEGAARADLESRAAAQLPGACRFLGQWRDVIGLHHVADCFVQASDGEGTSNALLEAMAMGTPVIATAVGGTASMLRDGVDGLLVPAGDAAALAAAVARTLDAPDLTAQRTRNARARIEREFSFAQRMDRVERIYEDLVARRPAGRRAPGGTAHA